MTTRTVEECELLVLAWNEGHKERVVAELGGEPSEKFLWEFRLATSADPGQRALESVADADLFAALAVAPVVEISLEDARKAEKTPSVEWVKP